MLLQLTYLSYLNKSEVAHSMTNREHVQQSAELPLHTT